MKEKEDKINLSKEARKDERKERRKEGRKEGRRKPCTQFAPEIEAGAP